MPRPDLPPPPAAVKSFSDYLDQAQKTKRVSTLLGEKNSEGNTFLDLPRWFTRKGLRTFEIETGFGVVRCVTPDHKTQRQMEDADEAVTRARNLPETSPVRAKEIQAAETRRDEMRRTFALRMIRAIPSEWANEGDAVNEGDLHLATAATLPAPDAVARMGPLEQRVYETLLPLSLLPQVMSGFAYMALPPLPVDEIRSADPS